MDSSRTTALGLAIFGVLTAVGLAAASGRLPFVMIRPGAGKAPHDELVGARSRAEGCGESVHRLKFYANKIADGGTLSRLEQRDLAWHNWFYFTNCISSSESSA
jgi:hypothetical protein